MKLGLFVRIAAVALLCQFATACASHSNNNPPPTAKGHWETLPPVTGSMIPRKVWVDDNGNVNNTAGSSSVQTSSGESLNQVQKTSGAARPGR
jgi:hypothetical protein